MRRELARRRPSVLKRAEDAAWHRQVGRDVRAGVVTRCPVVGGMSKQGETVIMTPTWRILLCGVVLLSAPVTALAQIQVGVNMSVSPKPFVEGVHNDALPSLPDLPAYYRVDLHVGWEAIDDHLTVFANLRNAFDRSNRIPSVWNAEHGVRTMGINASVGVSGTY